MDKKEIGCTELEQILISLGKYLQKPTRLLIIGSAIGIQMGQPSRMTHDIDVLMDESDYDIDDLYQACQKAGLEFNPKEYEEPEKPYLQIIHKSNVGIGKFDDSDEVKILTTGNLTVVRPPLEHIIASKLTRGTNADFNDILFLHEYSDVSIEEIEKAIDTLRPYKRNIATENLELLLIMINKANPCQNS